MDYKPNTDLRPNMSGSTKPAKQVRRSRRPLWTLIIFIIVLLILGFFFRSKISGLFGQGSSNATLSGYQAVFLVNGQVYFGQLSNTESDYITLKDVFYLQASNNNQLQPSASASATTANNSQLSLVKLGNELHGPDDAMYINRQQILFYEDLKSDGRVAQAITQYQSNKTSTPTN